MKKKLKEQPLRIAVVCALNIDKNPGMVTVDRAAHEFFAGRGLDVDWLVAGKASSHKPGVDDMIGFRSIFEEPNFPEKYDRIVFWGDFLQSRVHHESLIPWILEARYARSPDEAKRLLRRKLLLENANDELLERVAIIGSTILADGVETILDEAFRIALSRLLAGARCVRLREPVSAYRAAMLSGRDGTVGMDAAFLSMKDRVWNEAASQNRCVGPMRIAVVGGRSDRRHGRKLKFAALAALRAFERRRVDAVLEVLPWLSHGLGKWGWFKVETPSTVRSVDYCLERLGNCDALITDVYHAAVNAWVLGIPVVLLGKGAEFDTTAIKSKKKELLALSLFAGENYLFFETIGYFEFRALGERLRKILTNEARNATIFKQRSKEVTKLLATLEDEIGLPKRSPEGLSSQAEAAHVPLTVSQ